MADNETQWSVSANNGLPVNTVIHAVDVPLDPAAAPAGQCQRCQQRPATQWWCPGGALALAHGMAAAWCELCVVTEQLQHCREAAARIPELEAAQAQLQAAATTATDTPR